MEGLLQAALAMWACKVGFGVLCLPTLRGSLSSVGLCCGCLLLLTDLAITLFLAVLWLAEPWLLPSRFSTDRIALRSLLFLTHTYGHVMLLFVPLVAVEMVFHLHKPPLRGVEVGGNGGMKLQTRKGEDGGKDLHTKGGEDGGPLCPEKGETDRRETSPEAPLVRSEPQDWDTSTAGTLAHVVCVLSCLLAWCVSGLHTLHCRDLDGATVELCLEEGSAGAAGGSGGSGGSLFWCLPSLLSTTAVWPGFSKSCWGLPAAAILLELYGSLRLIHILSASSNTDCPERATPSPEEEEEERAGVQGIVFTSDVVNCPGTVAPSPEEEEEEEEKKRKKKKKKKKKKERAGIQGIVFASDVVNCPGTATPSPEEEEKESTVVQVPRQTAHMGTGRLTLLYEDQAQDTDVHRQTQTQHTALRAAVNPTVAITTQSLFVDTETIGDRCCVLSTVVRQASEGHRPPRQIDGQRCPSSRRYVPSEWSPSGDERSRRQIQNNPPPVPAQQRPQQSVPEMRHKSMMMAHSRSHSDRGSRIGSPQLCSQRWAFPGDSPGPRALLIVGLVWGVFVCLFPVPLAFSILLLRHTETLLLFGLKVLTRPPSHHKHTEST